jgi:hypothetical protein
VNREDNVKIVAGFAVVLVGLVAGLLLGTGMAAWTARGLPESSWTMRFQLEDALFAKTMPPLFLVTLGLLVVTSAMSAGDARIWFGVAAGLMLAVLAITIAREVPLNKEIQGWTPGAAPLHWSVVRDRWMMNHWIRTFVGVCALTCGVVGLNR